ncbi:MAG TPA: IS200/IS605 family transposase [Chryseolinea sp.]|nr:IS200/IS605 family transposase [Chryseolinea sp.]
MPNTYTQISIQAVFAVQGRKNFISNTWRDVLHQYIAGIIRKEATVLAVGGWKDHVHIFFGLPPNLRISDLIQKTKANSSRWINEQKFVGGKFQWQQGYGAFSYSKSHRDAVIKYIIDQERHHKDCNFQKEYLELLCRFQVNYDPKYMFEFYD